MQKEKLVDDREEWKRLVVIALPRGRESIRHLTAEAYKKEMPRHY